jgi:hypothetical protein
MKLIFIAIAFTLLFGCTKQPWMSQPSTDGYTHVSPQYFNYLSDEIECKWLKLAKPTQNFIVKPLQLGRNGFTTYEDCMYKKGYR